MLFASLSAAVLMSVSPPPRRYDHEPVKAMEIVHMTPAKVKRWCGHHRYAACTITLPQGCVVALPAPQFLTEDAYDRLFRHERAHCNGWKHR